MSGLRDNGDSLEELMHNVVSVTERAVPKLREMQKEGQPTSFRLVFKGFG